MTRVLLTLALLCASPAFAEGFYVYGAAGLHTSGLGANKAERESVSAAALGQQPDNSFTREDNGGKLQIGYRFSPMLSAEAGWLHLGRAKYDSGFHNHDPINPRLGSVDEDWTVQGISFSAVAIAPIGNRFSVIGKAGAVRSETTYTQTVRLSPGDMTHARATDVAWSPAYGVGVMYELPGWQPLAVRLEYESTRNVGGEATGKRNIGAVSFGVMYGF
jgi:hypothetical protein